MTNLHIFFLMMSVIGRSIWSYADIAICTLAGSVCNSKIVPSMLYRYNIISLSSFPARVNHQYGRQTFHSIDRSSFLLSSLSLFKQKLRMTSLRELEDGATISVFVSWLFSGQQFSCHGTPRCNCPTSHELHTCRHRFAAVFVFFKNRYIRITFYDAAVRPAASDFLSTITSP